MKNRSAATVTLAVLLVCGGTGCRGELVAWLWGPKEQAPQKVIDRADRQSTFIKLHRKQLPPFLQGLSMVVDEGVDYEQIARIDETFREVSIAESKSLRFPVTFRRTRTELEVQAFLDETGEMDVYFFSMPSLVEAIDEVIAEYEQAMAVREEAEAVATMP